MATASGYTGAHSAEPRKPIDRDAKGNQARLDLNQSVNNGAATSMGTRTETATRGRRFIE